MDTDQASDAWFRFAIQNKRIVKPIHSAIIHWCFALAREKGWPREFQLPTVECCEIIGVTDRETFHKALKELVSFGAIKILQDSTGRHVQRWVSVDLPLFYRPKKSEGYTEGRGEGKGEGKRRNQQKPKSLHAQLQCIIEGFNPGYYWQPKDGAALKRLIAKMKFRFRKKNDDREPVDEDIVNSFRGFVDNLPEFYRDKWDTCLLDSKFESIIKEITENRKNGQQQSTPTNGSTNGISERLAEGMQLLAARHAAKQS